MWQVQVTTSQHLFDVCKEEQARRETATCFVSTFYDHKCNYYSILFCYKYIKIYLLSWKKITNIFAVTNKISITTKNNKTPKNSKCRLWIEIRIITSEEVPLHTIDTSPKIFSKKPPTLEHEWIRQSLRHWTEILAN